MYFIERRLTKIRNRQHRQLRRLCCARSISSSFALPQPLLSVSYCMIYYCCSADRFPDRFSPTLRSGGRSGPHFPRQPKTWAQSSGFWVFEHLLDQQRGVATAASSLTDTCEPDNICLIDTWSGEYVSSHRATQNFEFSRDRWAESNKRRGVRRFGS